ncbi:MAG: hypothetical protein P8X82_15840 [Gemmatimonadales bacterium]
MNERIRTLLAGHDLSLPLAMAALVEVADGHGVADFGVLVLAYRSDHLELLRREKGDEVVKQSGALSVDEVRHHMLSSVLPRMIEVGMIDPVAQSVRDVGPASTLSVHAPRASGVAGQRDDLRSRSIISGRGKYPRGTRADQSLSTSSGGGQRGCVASAG